MAASGSPDAGQSSSGSAFLGVERSVTGRKWVGLSPEQDRLAQTISQRTGLPDSLCRVLARQGIDPEFVDSHLQPKLRDLMADPSHLLGMDTAVERFVDAVEGREKIAVFADYDVDGGCSAAQLVVWLRQMGSAATLYVPDRLSEGYGPNPKAMAALAACHSLIICVDCGTTAHKALQGACNADVIVLDHHSGDPELPPAVAVVNPNRQDESTDLTYLCAAGVVFFFLVAVNRHLREKSIAAPDLWSMLDLVALATVADVVPLVGLNRALVRQGISVMRKRARPGLRALADAARLHTAPEEYHLGFVIGPRINAGGRIGQADLGARILCTSDEGEADSIAEQLDALNQERQLMVEAIYEPALAQAEKNGLDHPLVWAAGEWHPGVLGIVASRLSEKTNRPAIVIGIRGGIGSGSGRSVRGVDLGSAIARCRANGFLIKGGGHRMAAGITVDSDMVEPAMVAISSQIAAQAPQFSETVNLKIDGAVIAGAVDVALVESISRAGPYGAGSPFPRFALPAQRIASRKILKEVHVKFSIADGLGRRIDAIAFNAMKSDLGPFVSGAGRKPVHVAGRLRIDSRQGRRKPILHVEDAAEA